MRKKAGFLFYYMPLVNCQCKYGWHTNTLICAFGFQSALYYKIWITYFILFAAVTPQCKAVPQDSHKAI